MCGPDDDDRCDDDINIGDEYSNDQIYGWTGDCLSQIGDDENKTSFDD